MDSKSKRASGKFPFIPRRNKKDMAAKPDDSKPAEAAKRSEPVGVPDKPTDPILTESNLSIPGPPSERDSVLLTAVKKRNLNRFTVSVSAIEDGSIVGLHKDDMERLRLFRGDTVLVHGRRRRETVLIVLEDGDAEPGTCRLDRSARNNLNVGVASTVIIRPCPDIKYLKRAAVLPIVDTIEGLTGSLFDDFLAPHFREAYRPLHKGDVFVVRRNMRYVEFKVTDLDPGEYGIVSGDTIIHSEGNPVVRERLGDPMADLAYHSIGGYRQQMMELRSVVEVQCRYPHRFRSLGVQPVRGILLHGPPGSGKTRIARVIANEADVFISSLNGFESVADLKKVFEVARASAPSMVFIDNIDMVFRRGGTGDNDQALTRQLLWEIDALNQGGVEDIFLLAACNDLDAVEPIFRTPGRFELEINIGETEPSDRVEILQVLLMGADLSDDVDLETVAEQTEGFLAGDLAGLCREAAMQCVWSTYADTDDFEDDDVNSVAALGLKLRMEDFYVALGKHRPLRAGKCATGCAEFKQVCKACGKLVAAGTFDDTREDQVDE